MGGYGSGQWRTGKTTTEESKRLDIRFMRKQGWLFDGGVGTLSWSIGDKPNGSIGYTINRESIILNYDFKLYGETESTAIKQTIFFETTACHYGGERQWFLCPHCNSRKEILYLHGRYFTCRNCANLAYQSQHEQPLDRNYRQARKIRHKLINNDYDYDFNPNNLSHTPLFKPKFMHQTTWDRLRLKQSRYIDTAMIQLVKNYPAFWGNGLL